MMRGFEPDTPQRWTVSYRIDGRMRATTHVEPCYWLERARENQEAFDHGQADPKLTQHSIVEEGNYLAHAPAEYPAPKECSGCLGGAP